PERVAINIDDARIPDNDNQQPIDQPIQKEGSEAYFTTLPVKRMVEAMKKEGVPASLSNSAGTFVCNHIMYQLLYLAATSYPGL
ncbi:pyroglutamyl-peptidase I family protein, partial [Staphylococcus aureus]